MKTKRIIALLLFVVMALSMAACGSTGGDTTAPSAAPADNGTSTPADNTSSDDHSDWIKADWSFATFLTEKNPFQDNITALQKNLDNYCEGTIQITTYPSGTLAGQSDMMDALDNGTCELAYVQVDCFTNRFPVSQLANYPSLRVTSALAGSKIWKEFVETAQLEELDDYVVWLWQASGPTCFFTTNPVASVADLQGLQIAATGAISGNFVKSLGATPVTLDSSDVYEAIRNGLVSGKFGMFGAAAMSNLDEVASNALVIPTGNYVFLGLMKRDLFESMPASQQEAFLKAAEETFNTTTIYYQDAGLAGNPRVAECVANSNLVFADDALTDEMLASAAPMVEDYIQSLNDQGYDGQGYYDLLCEIAEKYNQEFTWEQYQECYYDASYFAGTYPAE